MFAHVCSNHEVEVEEEVRLSTKFIDGLLRIVSPLGYCDGMCQIPQ